MLSTHVTLIVTLAKKVGFLESKACIFTEMAHNFIEFIYHITYCRRLALVMQEC